MYKTTNDNYLGTVTDMSHNKVYGFRVAEEIHLLHDLDHPLPFVRSIEEIKGDMDKYLWTPYALFVSRLK